MSKAIITTGLGWGDECKGATVDFLCRKYKADLVVRYSGGCQAGHNVELPDGRRHTFSQFGAGTFAGVPTYLGKYVIIDPLAMVREARHLRELGTPDPFDSLTVHPKCLVSTFYHQQVNRIKELRRHPESYGQSRHGSCGQGIGETREYWLKYGRDAIVADDLGNLDLLQDKLNLLRSRYQLNGFLDDSLNKPILEVAIDLRRRSLHTDRKYYNVCPYNTVVFEGAQGVLLDEWYGFYPHTTWSTVTSEHALEMCDDWNIKDVKVLGLTRTYATRHGVGPFPTHSCELSNDDRPNHIRDIGNPENKWQSWMRFGDLDMVLLKYAAKACKKLDGIVVSCLDQIKDKWWICERYDWDYDDKKFLEHDGRKNSIEQQKDLGHCLSMQHPVGRTRVTKDQLLEKLSEIAPIVITSDGPTFEHRKVVGDGF